MIFYDIIFNNVGYINLSIFFGIFLKDFKKIFLKLKKEGIILLVIDLCGNGGGCLEEVVEIVNFFLFCGKVIVMMKGKIKQVSNIYKILCELLDFDILIIVLVNGVMVFVFEIFFGVFQDFDCVVIVGSCMFGKGLVQIICLLFYGGVMKFIIFKYYIFSGCCVQVIDYKYCNEDGSVGIIFDSLIIVFYMVVGCEVCDGGGVMLDIEVKQEKLFNIFFYLVCDNLIFDYVMQYCLKYLSIFFLQEFKVIDVDYNDFKVMVKKVDFKYDQ